jgi:hypothetical protein
MSGWIWSVLIGLSQRAHVPRLQTGRQVASLLTVHLGNPIPSPALFEKIDTQFRADVRHYAAQYGIPWIVSARETASSTWFGRCWTRRPRRSARVVAVGVPQVSRAPEN